MKAQRNSSQSRNALRKKKKKQQETSRNKKVKNPKWHGHVKSLQREDLKKSLSPSITNQNNEKPQSSKLSFKCQKRLLAANLSDEKSNTLVEESHYGAAGMTSHRNGHTSHDVDESQYWRSYAQSVLQNGIQSSDEDCALSNQLGGEMPTFHAQYDCLNNRTLVVMQPGQTLSFRGKCQLTCLFGNVEVFGFTIEEGQQSYPLYSPASHCPLTITALAHAHRTTHPNGNAPPAPRTHREGRQEAKMVVRKFLSCVPKKNLLSGTGSDSCVVLLEPLNNSLTRFLASQSQLDELFELTSKELREDCALDNSALTAVGVLGLRCGSGGLLASRSHRDVLHRLVKVWGDDECERCPVILVYGAKNSGKSTFIRHLINSLLNHTTAVEYLECDVGQTEFTPPGCLSLSTVTEPLFGPPFTHQRPPRHMVYYGQADCQADLDRYLGSIKSLWKHSTGDMPVLINTMGWVKGPGFQLLIDLLRLLPVTHVVQFNFGETSQCPALTPDFMRTACGWQTQPPAPPALGHQQDPHHAPPPHTHLLLTVHSEFQGAGTSGDMRLQRSNEIRDLALLGYLSQLQSPESTIVRPLHCFLPYQVSLSSVAIGVTHCEVAPAHVLYSANASLVGLCCLEEKVIGQGRGPVVLSQTPICPCVGLGVVRGVDMVRGMYLIVTPVPPNLLSRVNCLLIGEISLPKVLLTTQAGVEGELPYVTTDYSFEVTGAGKVHVFKGLARPGFGKTQS